MKKNNKLNFIIHMVGIKGVGMASLAILLKQAGYSVSGSDLEESQITDKALEKENIFVKKGFSEENIKGCSLVIATGAHGGLNNREVVAAKAIGIPVLSFGEAVGKMMQGTLLNDRDFFIISISGTHGKTTTSGMVATLFSKIKLDPSYIIGTSEISSLGLPGHYGKGKYFIVEADEYATDPVYDKRAKFLWHKPNIAVVTSIEHDHPDIYKNEEEFIAVFEEFTKNISDKGVLIICGDSNKAKEFISKLNINFVTYGFSSSNDYVITRFFVSGEQTFFWVRGKGMDLGEFRISVPGEHNALNALASILVALESGIDIDSIRKNIGEYKGAKRRMEFIKKTKNGSLLYDDYAHHPTEIRETISAFKHMYPRSSIIVIFQPHTFSRTSAFFHDFSKSFVKADRVIILDIFGSARESGGDISSRDLVDSAKKYNKYVEYLSNKNDIREFLSKLRTDTNTLIVTMGAGDVYKLHNIID